MIGHQFSAPAELVFLPAFDFLPKFNFYPADLFLPLKNLFNQKIHVNSNFFRYLKEGKTVYQLFKDL